MVIWASNLISDYPLRPKLIKKAMEVVHTSHKIESRGVIEYKRWNTCMVEEWVWIWAQSDYSFAGGEIPKESNLGIFQVDELGQD